MIEEWKDIIGFEMYQISNLGKVKSKTKKVLIISKNNSIYNRTYYGKILSPSISNGYYRINLRKNNKYYRIKISRLVAIHFISNILNKPQINHINGIKTDDFVNNLEWCTPSENVKHAFNIGLRKPPTGGADKICGEKNYGAKLNEFQVRVIRKLKGELTGFETAKYFNVSWQLINRIRNNRCWKHIL